MKNSSLIQAPLKQLPVALGGAVAIVLTSATAQAAIMSVPDGLNPGDHYRLAFVTSGLRNPTSADIADYNTFVNSLLPGSALQADLDSNGLTPQWFAIGSTASVSAIENTGTDPNLPIEEQVPIYLIRDSELVASSYSDMWDGTLINPINTTENDTMTSSLVWTGTQESGQNVFLDTTLGGGSFVRFGRTTNTDTLWINEAVLLSTNNFRLYGISSVLEVPGLSEELPFISNNIQEDVNGNPAILFPNLPSETWVAPPNTFLSPSTSGFIYNIDPTDLDSAFTSITLPTVGFENDIFNVAVGNNPLGQFGSGSMINFADHGFNTVPDFSVIADAFSTPPISSLTSSISPAVDIASTDTFPLLIEFNNPTDNSFTLTAIEAQTTPEPSSLLGLITLGGMALFKNGRFRK